LEGRRPADPFNRRGMQDWNSGRFMALGFVEK